MCVSVDVCAREIYACDLVLLQGPFLCVYVCVRVCICLDMHVCECGCVCDRDICM